MHNTLQTSERRLSPRRGLGHQIWEARYLYLLLLPAITWYIVWCYIPLDGVLLAFKKYSAKLGIWGSPWVGFDNFKRIFITPAAVDAITNTLEISLTRLVVEFPIPIILALMLNEVINKRGKKLLQTVYTLPHFLSWVIVAAICSNFFSNAGFFNSVLRGLGLQSIDFLANKTLFRPFLYFTSVWKEAGWSSIIFLAAISSVDPALYEAAELDGANRLQMSWHITLAGIQQTIVLMFILQVGSVMNAGFDQIYNLKNGAVAEVAQIIDTYVYQITFEAAPSYGFSAAVDIFKAVINLLLMLTANKVCRRVTGAGMFQ